jgi:hypothetical protein
VPASVSRLYKAAPPGSPAAVWTAFAAQGRWKNWVLLGQLGCIVFLTAVCLRITKTEPDVVVVGPDGSGQYVQRAVAGEALLRFIQEQKQQPSDVTVVAFTRRFLQASLAVNSSTIDEAWPQALRMMAPPLREKMSKEAASQKLLETYRLAQVRTELQVDELLLVERSGRLTHVRATVTRRKAPLIGNDTPTEDAVQVELVENAISRSLEHPDGLEVLEWRITPAKIDPQAASETHQ